TLQRDAGGTIERLAEERDSLMAALEAQADDQQKAADAAREAGNKLAEQETTLDRLTEEAARLAARTAAAERRLEEAETATTRLAMEIAGAETQMAALQDDIAAGEADFARLSEDLTAAQTAARSAEDALTMAEAARAAAQETEGEARAALSDTEGEVSALSAEVQGLEKLLTRDAGDGTKLIDRITVEPGLETALGAAIGEELSADEVTALTDSGWVGLDPYADPALLPDGATPLAGHVTAPALLDRRLSQTGVVAADQGDALQDSLKPGQRLVSREGDLWRWDGYRVRSGEISTAAALRLQQRNRLTRLQDQLSRAEDLRARAGQAYDGAKASLEDANLTEAQARQTRRNADQSAADAARAQSRAEAEMGLKKSQLTSQADALEMRRGEQQAATDAVDAARADLDGLDDVAEARKAVDLQRGEVDLARTAMLSARSIADEIRRTGAARERRLTEVRREHAVWEDRLTNAGERIEELTARAVETKAKQVEIADTPTELGERRAKLAGEIEQAEVRRKASAEALASGEAELRTAENAEREAERTASTRREDRARLEAVMEGLAARTEDAANEIRAEIQIEPAALLEYLEADPASLPDLEAADTDVARLRRQRDALGAVNLRAEEDANEVREERDGIETEKSDLDEAIAKLRRGIAELNREGRHRLLEAFENVNKRFANLFRHLFNGGEARLVMVESEDPLDAGLEILCQPPGKKLSTLSLLSGGEQTLTALSLIFAVFLSNPAPICVLDEVDAPLDDSNVTRFCDLLDEMCRLTETRFLIITHHAITMSRMDRLFGVTMVERGVSQLVSVDLKRASELVDA
ncbi:MAG: chromosome segregation protein SMC, partial [Pseudomonadota bacterium]